MYMRWKNWRTVFLKSWLHCRARQLAGYKSEIERSYTPPSVSPAVLGREGERWIEQAGARDNVKGKNFV